MSVRPDFKLVHVGVAVPALNPAADVLTSVFGYRVLSGPFEDQIQKVAVNFLTRSDADVIEIELVAPLTDDAPVMAMLKKNGGGAYHLCFETSDMEAALKWVTEHGCIVFSPPEPAIAFGGRKIAWIYTQTRQLFELLEA
jgi:methylmalonyl-CoA/ethylmalonyl-CoA epimerase